MEPLTMPEHDTPKPAQHNAAPLTIAAARLDAIAARPEATAAHLDTRAARLDARAQTLESAYTRATRNLVALATLIGDPTPEEIAAHDGTANSGPAEARP